MGEDVVAVFYGKSDRLHQATTGCRTIARVHIDVSAPEAFRAMVGVAVSFDSGATVRAGEIFNVALESFVHRLVPAFFAWLSRSNVRFRLGDTVAARSKFQCSRTNSLKSVLYSVPIGKFAPGIGTNVSRIALFRLLRASETRNSLGFKISSVGDGM